MPALTTKMSSRGQVVIPEEIRQRLGLKTGETFLVLGDKDVVILKALSSPSIIEFKQMIKEARRKGKEARLKKSDITHAIAKSRI
jgi:AbrB family looped-hinge helix DNA binding protein